MRRYIFDITDYDTFDTDVAILGSGLAGLYAAYHLAPSLKVSMFTKEKMETSSSSLAQGGIAAVTEKDDAFLYHFQDTINAGAGLCDKDAVRVIVEEGPKEIEQMLKLGTQFDIDSQGHLLTTREGGHGMNRILHAGGDATGLEMVRTLKKTVLSMPNVNVHENAFAADIITEDGCVKGLMVNMHGKWHLYRTSNIIVATGGLGQIYRYTTNPIVATGDGFAMARRAGAQLADMAFIQFHPTGLYTPENRNKQCFLISEAVRGEGGVLLNDAGERFMKRCHPLAELAPRDIVAREIYREIQKQEMPYVRLDITHMPKEFLMKRFPTIYSKCMEMGIDMSKDGIPVGPVQHYMMGGIKTDLWGLTNVKGLLACGEAACTGVHGANRLASNSTLECLVFGRRCAVAVNGGVTQKIDRVRITSENTKKRIDVQKRIIELKGIMVKYCGILRNGYDMNLGMTIINDMLKELSDAALPTQVEMEFGNMALVAFEIIRQAYERKESVGSHCRIDEGGNSDV